MKSIKKFIVASALLIAGTVNAACVNNDAWVGRDKTIHFGAGMAAGSVATLVFKDPDAGFLFGASVGFMKELYDKQHPDKHTCSFQDFAVTALGAAAGAYGTAWIVTPNFVGFAKKF